jgi:LemA protein
MNYIVIAIVVVLVLLILYVIGTYNGLVSLRNKKDDQWSQIDVQLKRRADLIPNLVEIVKGYAKHESETLEKVIEARNTYMTAKTPEEEMKASGEVTQALNKLLALSEAYPELKANQNFLGLQQDVSDTEDKISYARQFYNDSVLTYNNKVQMFPSNIIAGMFNFTKASFFEVSDSDKEAPKISF